ncbi:MAG: hypothetical protein ACI4EA_08160 [Candidatus Ornithomonoglobus sp.]
MIYVKRIRRQCGMRGCRNTDTYSLSQFNEIAAGNIIICKDCLKAAMEAVESCTMPEVDYSRKAQSPPPPLFHNTVAETVKEDEQIAENVSESKQENVAAAKKPTTRKRTVKSE